MGTHHSRMKPVLELPSFTAAEHGTERVRLIDENLEWGFRGGKLGSNP